MASVTEKPRPKPTPAAEQQLVDRQISRTRRALKVVDWVAGLIRLAIYVLAFLLVTAVLEHWVIPGGWSDTARTVLFGVLLLGIGWYCWRVFWPLLRQSINPVYAAQAIEQSSPTLKNSLLNLLLLRGNRRRMSPQVYQAIEQQAAQGLSTVRMETVVDRSSILRLGYVLVALTAVCALYRFLSPKDLLSSAGRVLAPWASIATPSRVHIASVTPGDAKVARGELLKVSAEVFGLDEDEPVHLFYTTADEQIVRQEIPMSASVGGNVYSCEVPRRGGRGVEQDFTYWIEAGDARSSRHQVRVFARPTLVVNQLRYEYPAYTGYPSRTVEHTGDIRAVEGTKVTLIAQANKPIKSAHVDFDADGRRDLLMRADGQQATVTFPLALREDRRTPEHQSYVLRYLTTDGNQNEKPPKYQIDVVPDFAPEIQLLLPEEAELEVAVNQEVNFELEARDPDFALSKIMLVGQRGEEQLLQEELLSKDFTGKFVGKLRKTPAEMGLKAGDVLEYWGVAADNRQPEANIATSARRKLRVTGPWQGNENGQGDQPGDSASADGGDQSESGEGGQEGQAGGGETGNSGEGEEGDEGQAGAKGQESGEPNENQDQQGQGESASADGDSEGEDSKGDGNAANDNAGSDSSDSPEDGSDPSEGNNANPNGDSSGEPGKVSSEGDDDGTAFEKMAEHFNEQQGKQSSPGESASADGDAQSKPDQNAEGDPTADPNEAQSKDPTEGQAGTEQEAAQEDQGAQGEPAPGESASADGEPKDQQEPGTDPTEGQMSPEQGNAGAGEEGGQEQGAPNPAGAKEPTEKQDPGESEATDGDESGEPPATARDGKESDSQGGQGGDRSGGGEKGAGQQADEAGKGGAGEHEAADDGGGKASEQGEGETGDQPGDQSLADGKTGESSGDQAGPGTEQRPSGEGEKPGGEPATEGQPGDQNQPPGEPASAGGEPQDSTTGTPGQTTPPPGELAPGDKANLEYTRKQTDLILDKLEDQLKKQQVDESLLEKLGWTKDELRRFVDRWKNLQAEAAKDGAEDAKSELNDALRSLGFDRNRRTGYRSKITADQLRDLREGYRGKVPLEYQEQVRSYLKGTATVPENE